MRPAMSFVGRHGLQKLVCLMQQLNDDLDGEGKQAQSNETERQLLSPVLRVNFREQLQAIVNEVTEASGRYEHEEADAAPCQDHRAVNEYDAKQPAHPRSSSML